MKVYVAVIIHPEDVMHNQPPLIIAGSEAGLFSKTKQAVVDLYGAYYCMYGVDLEAATNMDELISLFEGDSITDEPGSETGEKDFSYKFIYTYTEEM